MVNAFRPKSEYFRNSRWQWKRQTVVLSSPLGCNVIKIVWFSSIKSNRYVIFKVRLKAIKVSAVSQPIFFFGCRHVLYTCWDINPYLIHAHHCNMIIPFNCLEKVIFYPIILLFMYFIPKISYKLSNVFTIVPSRFSFENHIFFFGKNTFRPCSLKLIRFLLWLVPESASPRTLVIERNRVRSFSWWADNTHKCSQMQSVSTKIIKVVSHH